MKTYILFYVQILFVFSSIYSQDIWERTNGLDSISIVSLAVNSNGVILAGTDTNSTCSLFRSTDSGSTWTNIGYNYLKITGFVIKPSGEILMSSLDHHLGGGIFHSTDQGISWANLGYTGASTSIAINSQEDIYIGTLNNYVFRSTNNGNSWIKIDQGLTDPNTTSLIINTSGHIFVGTIDGGVFRSMDNGDNWVQINEGLTNYQILSLAINSNGNIFAGTSGGGVYRSTNNGDTWVQINQGLSGEGKYVLSFLVRSNSDIFAGTYDGVYRSTDYGDNWAQISQGLTDLRIFSFSSNLNGYIFAGTRDGVSQSINPLPVELSSFSLKQMTDKIQLNWVTKTEVNNYGFDVERRINEGEWNSIGFVEGHGNSSSPKEYSYMDKDMFAGGSKFQYRLKQIDTDGSFEFSDVVEVEVLPNQYELSQNYPNPFNPSTTIRFSLPQTSQIKIDLYNVIGEQVAVIAEGMYESGYHKIEFNAGSLPSGTYIYRFMSDSFVQTKKMMLLK